ncbi:MAG: hypothetical protein K2M04_06610 [Muribaculaceae bacterium]|nr:hypothetical protein [Muribaculaceae bacterium]
MYRIITVFLLLLLSQNFLFADNNKGSNTDIPITNTTEQDPPVVRPRMPSNRVIWLHYDVAQGRCSFDIPAGIEVLDVTIILDGCIYFEAIVTPEEPSFPLSLIPGSYSICCQSDAGRLFSASFTIE